MITPQIRKTRMDVSFVMNTIRILACMSIVNCHTLSYLYFQINNKNSGLFVLGLRFLMMLFSGEVFVFFILSGFGLSYSHYNNESPNVVRKFFYRFSRIIIPYWLVTCIFYFLLTYYNNRYPIIDFNYRFTDFIMHILLLRNFSSEAWPMLEHLWFIPVIISYYLIFPFLLKMMHKIGRVRFLCLSVFVTYVTFGILTFAGHRIMRLNSNFLYYLPMFSLGMVLGNTLFHDVDFFRKLFKIQTLITGISFIILTILMSRIKLLSNFNDMFTGIGLFFIMAYIVNGMIPYIPGNGTHFINTIYKHTYLTYLIHYPLVKHIMKPVFLTYNIQLNFALILFLGSLITIVLLYITKAIHTVNKKLLHYGI